MAPWAPIDLMLAFKSPAVPVDKDKTFCATDQGATMRHDGAAVAHQDDPRLERPPVDETVIDQLASITDGQGVSVLSELLNAFLRAVPDRLDALDLAVGRADGAAVAEQAHALTGSAASFGAVGMTEMCRELRTVAIEGDLGSAARLVGELQAEFGRVRTWLADFRGRP
jgi:HPt (histidine-containing phosphotransfer) domain-containing protein